MSAYRADGSMDEKYREFYIGKLPIVFVDRNIPGINRDVIQSENFDASYKATQYLLNMGHKKNRYYCHIEFLYSSGTH